jgi:plasmid stabilization system protein ParE
MLFRIEVTRSAEVDIENTYFWIYERNPEYADKWIRGLYRSVFTLRELPARCSIASESRELEREIRQLSQ